MRSLRKFRVTLYRGTPTAVLSDNLPVTRPHTHTYVVVVVVVVVVVLILTHRHNTLQSVVAGWAPIPLEWKKYLGEKRKQKRRVVHTKHTSTPQTKHEQKEVRAYPRACVSDDLR